MSEGYEEGERGYLQTVERTLIKKKKGGLGKGIERGKDRCISPENMSYLRNEGGGSRGRRDRARRDGRSSHDSKTFSTTRGHFSGTFLHVSGSEGAGGWRGQPFSDVDSVEKKVHRQGAGYNHHPTKPRCNR